MKKIFWGEESPDIYSNLFINCLKKNKYFYKLKILIK